MRFHSWGKCSMFLQSCKARVALGALLLAGLLPLAAVADIYNPFDGGGPQGNLVLTAGNTVAFNTSSSALWTLSPASCGSTLMLSFMLAKNVPRCSVSPSMDSAVPA